QADKICFAAVLDIKAALLVVVGDKDMFLARDGIIAEAQADALARIASDGVHADEQRAECTATWALYHHDPSRNRLGLRPIPPAELRFGGCKLSRGRASCAAR